MTKIFMPVRLALCTSALFLGAPALVAQSADDAPPVEQIQANPVGDRPASDTPPNPATASSPVPATMPADPNYRAGPYVGALSQPPAEAMNKTYPVCTRKMQDSCQNPGEGGASLRPLRNKCKKMKNK